MSSTLFNDHTVNVRFCDLLSMTDDEMTAWAEHLRVQMLRLWDSTGYPPLPNKTESQMVRMFRKLKETPSTVVVRQSFDDGYSVLEDVLHSASAVTPFFPAMMKTRISYTESPRGTSLYDLLSTPSRSSTFVKGCLRHFRRDSFYKYSPAVRRNDGMISASTGVEWIKHFALARKRFASYGFWLAAKKERTSSNYSQTDPREFVSISKKDVIQLREANILPDEALVNVRGLEPEGYIIRLYDKEKRLCPLGSEALKHGFSLQAPVNFPPMIARYLYEKYTDHCKKQPVVNIYDPSAGWGGRIAGAMLVGDDRQVHYIGTDPSTENALDDSTRYEQVANFINDAVHGKYGDRHTFDIFQLGAEVIGDDPGFRRYEGMLDLVMTSPPYFNREIYSDEATQSANKFPRYDAWVEGFLRPTLETAYKYLRPERYLLWNVADIRVGERYLPLERDSIDVLKSLGAQFAGKETMLLASMPGAERMRGGYPTSKNFVRVDGTYRKFEPVMVFRKPRGKIHIAIHGQLPIRHALPSEAGDIYAAFNKRRDIFPHIRKNNIEERITDGQCIYEKGVVITYQQYKRTTQVGTVRIPRGDIMLHQILNTDQFNGAGHHVFTKSSNRSWYRLAETCTCQCARKIRWLGTSTNGTA